jgi:hypothetical protein
MSRDKHRLTEGRRRLADSRRFGECRGMRDQNIRLDGFTGNDILVNCCALILLAQSGEVVHAVIVVLNTIPFTPKIFILLRIMLKECNMI